jgi:hypothetical protein
MRNPQSFSDVLNNVRENIEAKRAAETPSAPVETPAPAESKAPRTPRLTEYGKTSINAFKAENPQLAGMMSDYNPGRGATREAFTSQAFGNYIQQHPISQQIYGGSQPTPPSAAPAATSVPFAEIYQPREKYGPPEMQGPRFDRYGPPMPEGQRYPSPVGPPEAQGPRFDRYGPPLPEGQRYASAIGPQAPMDVSSNPRWDALKRVIGPQMPAMGGRGALDVSSNPNWGAMNRPLEVQGPPEMQGPRFRPDRIGPPMPEGQRYASAIGPEEMQGPRFDRIGPQMPSGQRYAAPIGPQAEMYGPQRPADFWAGATSGGRGGAVPPGVPPEGPGLAGRIPRPTMSGAMNTLGAVGAGLSAVDYGTTQGSLLEKALRSADYSARRGNIGDQAADTARALLGMGYGGIVRPAMEVGGAAARTVQRAVGAPTNNWLPTVDAFMANLQPDREAVAAEMARPYRLDTPRTGLVERTVADDMYRRTGPEANPFQQVPEPMRQFPTLTSALTPGSVGAVTPNTATPPNQRAPMDPYAGQQRGELDLTGMSFKDAFALARNEAKSEGVDATGRFIWNGKAYQTNANPARGAERYVPESRQTRLGNYPTMAEALTPPAPATPTSQAGISPAAPGTAPAAPPVRTGAPGPGEVAIEMGNAPRQGVTAPTAGAASAATGRRELQPGEVRIGERVFKPDVLDPRTRQQFDQFAAEQARLGNPMEFYQRAPAGTDREVTTQELLTALEKNPAEIAPKYAASLTTNPLLQQDVVRTLQLGQDVGLTIADMTGHTSGRKRGWKDSTTTGAEASSTDASGSTGFKSTDKSSSSIKRTSEEHGETSNEDRSSSTRTQQQKDVLKHFEELAKAIAEDKTAGLAQQKSQFDLTAAQDAQTKVRSLQGERADVQSRLQRGEITQEQADRVLDNIKIELDEALKETKAR